MFGLSELTLASFIALPVANKLADFVSLLSPTLSEVSSHPNLPELIQPTNQGMSWLGQWGFTIVHSCAYKIISVFPPRCSLKSITFLLNSFHLIYLKGVAILKVIIDCSRLKFASFCKTIAQI